MTRIFTEKGQNVAIEQSKSKGTLFDNRTPKVSKMRVDNNLIKNLANTANVINTINGGTVYPNMIIKKSESHVLVEVSVPSINPDDIKVEVNGSHLFVFQMIGMDGIRIPNILSLLTLSQNINLDHITANLEDDKLKVHLPFNEVSGGGRRREIEIFRN